LRSAFDDLVAEVANGLADGGRINIEITERPPIDVWRLQMETSTDYAQMSDNLAR
jgi:hypothetical protein